MASQGGRGTLYVVATPIGNLGDIGLRALEVLREVAVVAAEDTRVTRRLWSRYDIETPLVSHHAHSGPGRLATGRLMLICDFRPKIGGPAIVGEGVRP